MARSARSAGIPAGAWFARQSFHSSTDTQPRLEGAGPARIVATPAFTAPFALTAEADTTPDAIPGDLFGAATPADTRFYAGLLVDAIETRAALEADAADLAILAVRDAELEAEWDAERAGDACGRACGYCGRCS